LLPGETN